MKKETMATVQQSKKGEKFMKKHLLSVLLAATFMIGSVIPTQAASSDVTIEVKPTAMDNVSVTVPSTLPIIFNEDGSNTLPTNWTIENISSIAGVHLSTIDMDANGSGWKLLNQEQDTTKLSVDTKEIQFYVGKDANLKLVSPVDAEVAEEGTVAFGEDEISIDAGESQLLTFDVNRGAFTENLANAKAFDMILTFDFN